MAASRWCSWPNLDGVDFLMHFCGVLRLLSWSSDVWFYLFLVSLWHCSHSKQNSFLVIVLDVPMVDCCGSVVRAANCPFLVMALGVMVDC